jgi:hypothetical protein
LYLLSYFCESSVLLNPSFWFFQQDFATTYLIWLRNWWAVPTLHLVRGAHSTRTAEGGCSTFFSLRPLRLGEKSLSGSEGISFGCGPRAAMCLCGESGLKPEKHPRDKHFASGSTKN